MPATQIVCLGLSHYTAPVELREQIRCTLVDVQARLVHDMLPGHRVSEILRELVLVSTCNRVELYALVEGSVTAARGIFVDFLASLHGVPAQELAPHLYYHVGLDACAHLFRVAAGLDSMVLGEPQILGQVIRAHEAAVQVHTTGPYLNALFRGAMRTGKRARTETAISNNPASISSVAISQAQEIVGNLQRHRVLLVGLGEMNNLALKALRNRGVERVDIANRTKSRAEAVAADGHGTAYGLSELPEALQSADVVITATASPVPVITAEMTAGAVAQRAGRELVIIDIAVPRDVEPSVAELPGVHLFDIDALQASLDEALTARQLEVPSVEAIITEELALLRHELQEVALRPLIADLRKKAEAIRLQELERSLRFLGSSEPELVEQMNHFSRSLVNKLLHEPTIRLKEESHNGQSEAYAEAVRFLFGLDDA